MLSTAIQEQIQGTQRVGRVTWFMTHEAIHRRGTKAKPLSLTGTSSEVFWGEWGGGGPGPRQIPLGGRSLLSASHPAPPGRRSEAESTLGPAPRSSQPWCRWPGGSSPALCAPGPPTHLLLLLLYERLLVLPGGQEHISVLLADHVAVGSAGSAHVALEPAPALASLLPAVGTAGHPNALGP